jgi:hypothetical protein
MQSFGTGASSSSACWPTGSESWIWLFLLVELVRNEHSVVFGKRCPLASRETSEQEALSAEVCLVRISS